MTLLFSRPLTNAARVVNLPQIGAQNALMHTIMFREETPGHNHTALAEAKQRLIVLMLEGCLGKHLP